MGAFAPSPPGNELRARILANALLRDLGETERPHFRTEEYEAARQGAFMADVEGSALRFHSLIRIFTGSRDHGWHLLPEGFPVVVGEEGRPIPLDVTEFFLDALAVGGGIQYPIYNARPFRPWVENAGAGRFGEGAVSTTSLDVVAKSFQEGLIEFLNVRLESSDLEGPERGGSNPLRAGPNDRKTKRVRRSMSASGAWTGAETRGVPRSLGAAALNAAGTSGSPYLPFTIHTHRPGIDVEQAPAYFLSWTFFGGPTTPTEGWILPGLYRFRGRDHQGRYRLDPTKFKIPPSQSANTIL